MKKISRKEYCAGVIAICASVLLLAIVIFICFNPWRQGNQEKNPQKDIEIETENNGNESVQQEIPDQVEDFAIETPYGTLYYPKRWQEQVRIEHLKDEVYTLRFFGQVEGKEEQALFEIFFGEVEGYRLGSIEKEGDASVPVVVKIHKLNFEQNWTDSEKSLIKDMQENVNHIFEKISLIEGFEMSTQN